MSLVTILIFVLLLVLALYVIDQVPITPEQRKWVKIILAVLLILWLIGALTGYMPLRLGDTR